MFFERPEAGTQTLLVHIENDDSTAEELRELSLSAGLEPVAEITAKRRHPDPKTYVGSGKLDDIRKLADESEAHLILFDEELTPTQERNLEKSLERRVLGRTGLILNIFAQRARTHEGKLRSNRTIATFCNQIGSRMDSSGPAARWFRTGSGLRNGCDGGG